MSNEAYISLLVFRIVILSVNYICKTISAYYPLHTRRTTTYTEFCTCIDTFLQKNINWNSSVIAAIDYAWDQSWYVLPLTSKHCPLGSILDFFTGNSFSGKFDNWRDEYVWRCYVTLPNIGRCTKLLHELRCDIKPAINELDPT